MRRLARGKRVIMPPGLIAETLQIKINLTSKQPMRKLKVDLPVNNIKGEQLKDRCWKKDCLNCYPDPKVTTRKGDCDEGKKLTVGDMLLNLLSQSGIYDTKESGSNKFAFWVVEIGILISEAKGEVELSEDKYQFLKKIVEANKIQVPGRDKTEDYFVPFTLGQVLFVFDEEKIAAKEKAEKKAAAVK